MLYEHDVKTGAYENNYKYINNKHSLKAQEYDGHTHSATTKYTNIRLIEL